MIDRLIAIEINKSSINIKLSVVGKQGIALAEIFAPKRWKRKTAKIQFARRRVRFAAVLRLWIIKTGEINKQKMSITDSNGNFSEDFLKRLEDLKKDQKENLRELERLRIDAYLEVYFNN